MKKSGLILGFLLANWHWTQFGQPPVDTGLAQQATADFIASQYASIAGAIQKLIADTTAKVGPDFIATIQANVQNYLQKLEQQLPVPPADSDQQIAAIIFEGFSPTLYDEIKQAIKVSDGLKAQMNALDAQYAQVAQKSEERNKLLALMDQGNRAIKNFLRVFVQAAQRLNTAASAAEPNVKDALNLLYQAHELIVSDEFTKSNADKNVLTQRLRELLQEIRGKQAAAQESEKSKIEQILKDFIALVNEQVAGLALIRQTQTTGVGIPAEQRATLPAGDYLNDYRSSQCSFKLQDQTGFLSCKHIVGDRVTETNELMVDRTSCKNIRYINDVTLECVAVPVINLSQIIKQPIVQQQAAVVQQLPASSVQGKQVTAPQNAAPSTLPGAAQAAQQVPAQTIDVAAATAEYSNLYSQLNELIRIIESAISDGRIALTQGVSGVASAYRSLKEAVGRAQAMGKIIEGVKMLAGRGVPDRLGYIDQISKAANAARTTVTNFVAQFTAISKDLLEKLKQEGEQLGQEITGVLSELGRALSSGDVKSAEDLYKKAVALQSRVTDIVEHVATVADIDAETRTAYAEGLTKLQQIQTALDKAQAGIDNVHAMLEQQASKIVMSMQGGFPIGPWRDYCAYWNIQGATLKAQCRINKSEGAYQPETTLDITRCKQGQVVGSCNAQLCCQTPMEMQGGFPIGTWRDYCAYWNMQDSTLKAQCKIKLTDPEYQPETMLDITTCLSGETVHSCNGKLTCKDCPVESIEPAVPELPAPSGCRNLVKEGTPNQAFWSALCKNSNGVEQKSFLNKGQCFDPKFLKNCDGDLACGDCPEPQSVQQMVQQQMPQQEALGMATAPAASMAIALTMQPSQLVAQQMQKPAVLAAPPAAQQVAPLAPKELTKDEKILTAKADKAARDNAAADKAVANTQEALDKAKDDLKKIVDKQTAAQTTLTTAQENSEKATTASTDAKKKLSQLDKKLTDVKNTQKEAQAVYDKDKSTEHETALNNAIKVTADTQKDYDAAKIASHTADDNLAAVATALAKAKQEFVELAMPVKKAENEVQRLEKRLEVLKKAAEKTEAAKVSAERVAAG